MKRSFPSITLAASLAVVALGALPSQAHGTAAAGAMAGLTHPLLGVDHLLMLLALGTAASQLSFQVLPWALGGGLIGALCGLNGWSVPLVETLAALAVMAVAAVTLAGSRRGETPRALQLLASLVVGGGMGIHALLHGLEAPASGSGLLWWGGALLSSVVVCGVTAMLLRRVPQGWGRLVALGVLMAGGVLVVGA